MDTVTDSLADLTTNTQERWVRLLVLRGVRVLFPQDGYIFFVPTLRRMGNDCSKALAVFFIFGPFP